MNNFSKLGLGTVSWGLSYGVANQTGQTSREEVQAILKEAEAAGIRFIDTAANYGQAELILGRNRLTAFSVITKTPSFGCDSLTDTMAEQLRKVFFRSLQRLSIPRIYALLIHNADDLRAPGAHRLVEAMAGLKADGLVEKIGVSVYSQRQIDRVFESFKFDLVQLPVSVMDQRLLQSGHISALKRHGIEIHARSVFLQGLLLMPLDQIPAYFAPIRSLLHLWHTAASDQGMTLTQAALSFVRQIAEIDAVLVGINSLHQFRECLQDFNVDDHFHADGLSFNNEEFINPAMWRL